MSETLMVIAILATIVGLFVCGVWYLGQHYTGLHDVFCVCLRCKEKSLKTALQRRKWLDNEKEIEKAVADMAREGKL